MTIADATPALADDAGSVTAESNDGGSSDVRKDTKQATKPSTALTSAMAMANFSNFVDTTAKNRFADTPTPKPQSFPTTDQTARDEEVKRLASLLQADMLVPATQQALNEGNFDSLLIAGAKVADKVLDAIGRPYGMRFRGASVSISDDQSRGAYAGTELSLGGGADYRFHKDMLAGLAMAYERGGINTAFDTGGRTSEGATVAPYVGWRPIPELTLATRIGVSALGYSAAHDDGANTAGFDALRLFGSLNGTGAFHFGSLRLSPTAGLRYSEERQDGYTDGSGVAISEQTVSFGRLSSGLEVGYRLEQEYIGLGLEPYLRFAGDWDFVRPDDVSTAAGATAHRSQYAANLAGGLNLFNDAGLTGDLEGSLDRIGRADEERNVTIRGSLRYGF
jgi:hypothetical protein